MSEYPCEVCGKQNDIGVKVCWHCGGNPHLERSTAYLKTRFVAAKQQIFAEEPTNDKVYCQPSIGGWMKLLDILEEKEKKALSKREILKEAVHAQGLEFRFMEIPMSLLEEDDLVGYPKFIGEENKLVTTPVVDVKEITLSPAQLAEHEKIHSLFYGFTENKDHKIL